MIVSARPDYSPKNAGEALLQSRYRGCLLGGAVGDALGAAVEFMSDMEILQTFGPDGIRDYAFVYGGLGRITDDTQMTLFTAEGLLRAYVRASLKGIGPVYSSVTATAYQRWLLTQERRSVPRTLKEDERGWLIGHPELFSRRAPGKTCLMALKANKPAGEPAVNDSKGCGGVMRVAPVGMYFAAPPRGFEGTWRHDDIGRAFREASSIAALTHGHPTGQLTAGVLAAVIVLLLNGVILCEAVQQAIEELRKHPHHEETTQALERACALAASSPGDPQALKSLGEGWIAEEALAMSIYCALGAKDFETAIVLAVNHSGDSDSTGAITGNILGAFLGLEALPERWLQPLELREVIVEMADDLRTVHHWKIDEDEPEEESYWWTRYPGC